jgi:hypothetical protein
MCMVDTFPYTSGRHGRGIDRAAATKIAAENSKSGLENLTFQRPGDGKRRRRQAIRIWGATPGHGRNLSTYQSRQQDPQRVIPLP